jgi:hypothetical protein
MWHNITLHSIPLVFWGVSRLLRLMLDDECWNNLFIDHWQSRLIVMFQETYLCEPYDREALVRNVFLTLMKPEFLTEKKLSEVTRHAMLFLHDSYGPPSYRKDTYTIDKSCGISMS